MATCTRFEDIAGWKKARELPGEIYRVTRVGAFDRGFGLEDRVRRSAVSVTANEVEGRISGLMKYLAGTADRGRKFAARSDPSKL